MVKVFSGGVLRTITEEQTSALCWGGVFIVSPGRIQDLGLRENRPFFHLPDEFRSWDSTRWPGLGLEVDRVLHSTAEGNKIRGYVLRGRHLGHDHR